MSETADPPRDASRNLFAEVVEAIGRRAALHGGAALEDLDRRLVIALEHLEAPIVEDLGSDRPPRSVATAMALTLFTQPHLVATFGRPSLGSGTERPAPAPSLILAELMQEFLGLEAWELEELQAEADRRVALHLKQHRLLTALWTQFGLPNAGAGPLVEVLFPGLRDASLPSIGLSRRGAQLYALVEQPRWPDPASMHLSWLDRGLEGSYHPRGTFSPRYVDASLLKTLCRAVGCDAQEAEMLLERTISVVPKLVSGQFLDMDRWRALAYEALTGLSGCYTRHQDPTAPIAPPDIAIDGWMRAHDGVIELDNLKGWFDTLAMERTTVVARQLHAHTLASLLYLPDIAAASHDPEELLRYDLVRHVRTVLTPVVDWADSPNTVEHVARALHVTHDQAKAALQQVHQVWAARLDTTWTGLPADNQPESVAIRLLRQVLHTRQALGQIWIREAELGQEHREAALLFAAHYFAEAPLDRIWTRDAGGLAEDPIGQWFWPLWKRMLYGREDNPATDETFML